MRLKKEEVFVKLSVFIHYISSTLTKNKRKKTINTAFISSYVCLKILESALVLFLQENIFGDEKLFPPPVENRL